MFICRIFDASFLNVLLCVVSSVQYIKAVNVVNSTYTHYLM